MFRMRNRKTTMINPPSPLIRFKGYRKRMGLQLRQSRILISLKR